MNGIEKHKISISVPQKSIALAIVLTMILGPIGLFYSTIPGAIIMSLITFTLSIATLGFGFLLTWPICVVWAIIAIKKYNAKKIEEDL